MRRVGEALVKDSQIQLIEALNYNLENGMHLRIEALVKDRQIQLIPITGIGGAR